jgi:hypothetical protein
VSHPVVRVSSFEIVGRYAISVYFDDRISRVIDFDRATPHDWPRYAEAFARRAQQGREEAGVASRGGPR